jgi:hypothetical protein
MGARDLLAELACLGVTVTADGDRLLIRPASKLTDELRAALRAHKAELLAAAAASPIAPLTAIAHQLPIGPREVLDCLLSVYPRAGGLKARDLAEASRLPIGVVLGALDLLHGAGLVVRWKGFWSPANALRRELATADRSASERLNPQNLKDQHHDPH